MEALGKSRGDIRIIGVNLGEAADAVKAYVSEMKLTFPVVIDTRGEVSRDYAVRFTPTHFLIDRLGTVRAGGSGGRDWNGPAAHAAVTALLEPAPSAPSPARRDRAGAPQPGSERR
ncbi:MAG: TlpA family protein disulfide reductase [Candidatus Rokubacteria bacterium]|nr:TlpA family protein disulfide reductase [Candidatus Rokubacteria bacterium]